MEAIVTGIITGGLSLVGIIISNSKHQAVIDERLSTLTKQVEKHNNVIERTYELECREAVAENDIVTLYKRTEELCKRIEE